MDKEMKERVEEAYREGYEDGSNDVIRRIGVNKSWKESWTKRETES